MSRRAITSLVFGQLGRLVFGHPLGCSCRECTEIDGHAGSLVDMLERAAAPDPSPAPLPQTVRVEVREVRQNRPARPALPAPARALPVRVDVDGQPARAELVPAPPKPRRAKRRPKP